jgi:TonB family protein
MRHLRGIAPLLLCFTGVTTLISCATTNPASQSPSGPTAHIEPPAEVAEETPRQLPRFLHLADFLSRNWYPSDAQRQGLTGNVVIEFRIAQSGDVEDARLLGADAAPSLQRNALLQVRSATFNVSDPKFNPNDPRPFRGTVFFCIDRCADLTPFPGSVTFAVSTRTSGSH